MIAVFLGTWRWILSVPQGEKHVRTGQPRCRRRHPWPSPSTGPEAKNAINLETAQALAAAFDELDGRDDLRIGILTGAGGTFSSGMDPKAFAQSGQRR